MDRKEAIETVKSYLPEYLRNKGIDTTSFFKCLSPDHGDDHPSMGYYAKKNICHCFACGANMSLIDLVKEEYGCSNFNEALKKSCELYNVKIDGVKEGITPRQATEKPKPLVDYSNYYEECRKHLEETDYLQTRGISLQTARDFGVGYDPSIGKLIIPVNKNSYVERNVSQNIEKGARYRKKGENTLFLRLAGYKDQTRPMFVVEGEIDAMSVAEAGYNCSGLGTTANWEKFVNFAEKHPFPYPVIIMLDSDREGQATAERMAEKMTSKGIPHIIAHPYWIGKDANEALLANKDFFVEQLQSFEDQSLLLAQANELGYSYIPRFLVDQQPQMSM